MSFQFLLCRVSREFISITCLFCSIYEQCFVRKFAKAVKSLFLVWLLKLFFYFHLQIVWWSRNLIFTSLPRFYPYPHPASSTNAISASLMQCTDISLWVNSFLFQILQSCPSSIFIAFRLLYSPWSGYFQWSKYRSMESELGK